MQKLSGSPRIFDGFSLMHLIKSHRKKSSLRQCREIFHASAAVLPSLLYLLFGTDPAAAHRGLGQSIP